MSIEVKISGADKARFNKDLKVWTDKFNKSVDNVLDAVAEDIEGEAKNILGSSSGHGNKKSDTGILKGSIGIDRSRKGVRTVGTSSGYGLYVEFGRPPGRGVKVDKLLGWVKRRTGKTGKAAEQFAKFVSFLIKKRGTKPFPFLRPAYERGIKRIKIRLRQNLAKMK